MPSVRRLVAIVATTASMGLLVGCGGSGGAPASVAQTRQSSSASSGRTGAKSGATTALAKKPGTANPHVGTAKQFGATLVATARPSHVDIHAAPGGRVTRDIRNPQETGAPLTFLVDGQSGKWLRVYLPVRPNGSTGWVSATDVTVAQVAYRVEVSTAAHQLRLYHFGKLVNTYSAATGTGGTPTPHGLFFITELLAPTNAGYGPYAYGLSAFSNVLTSFGGGPGQIGIHGTDNAASIGRSASHGCVRLSNTDITALAKQLPLGTSVNIT